MNDPQAVDEDGYAIGAQVSGAERQARREEGSLARRMLTDEFWADPDSSHDAAWVAAEVEHAEELAARKVQRRVLLVRTADPFTNLRPGSKGTVLRASADPFAPGHTILEVAWDDGSTLSLLSAAGDLWGLGS